MDKTLTISIIEAVIFLLPLITLFIKMGKLAQLIDDNTEDIHDLKVQQNDTTKLLSEISTTLAEISTKVTLLLENKIKTE